MTPTTYINRYYYAHKRALALVQPRNHFPYVLALHWWLGRERQRA